MMGVSGRSLLVLLFSCFTLTQQQGESWRPPFGWQGPTPILYRSFDSTSGLTLMEGSREQGNIRLVPGRIGQAVRLDETRRQWIDLGLHPEVCLTRPDRCQIGIGGALSMWIQVGPGSYTGLITTKENSGNIRGFTVVTTFNHIQTEFYVDGANFHNFALRPSDDEWFHVVINYFGSGEGQGFVMHVNGEVEHSERDPVTVRTGEGNGRIAIGRLYTETDAEYSTMGIDELLVFNKFLTDEEINLLYTQR